MTSSTISVPEAGAALGISRQTAYELTRRGEFPLPVIKVGAKLRVSRAALARLLGETTEVEASVSQ